MGYYSRATKTYTQSPEEREQEAAQEIGDGYMHGTLNIEDVVTYLNTNHHPLTYSEVVKAIKKGADLAILYSREALVESRVQPEQDAQEIAAIYSRKIVKKNWDNKPLYPKIVIARLTKEQSEEFNSDRYRRVQLEFINRSN